MSRPGFFNKSFKFFDGKTMSEPPDYQKKKKKKEACFKRVVMRQDKVGEERTGIKTIFLMTAIFPPSFGNNQ